MEKGLIWFEFEFDWKWKNRLMKRKDFNVNVDPNHIMLVECVKNVMNDGNINKRWIEDWNW